MVKYENILQKARLTVLVTNANGVTFQVIVKNTGLDG